VPGRCSRYAVDIGSACHCECDHSPPTRRARVLATLDASTTGASRREERGPVQAAPTNTETADTGRSTVRAGATPWEKSGFLGIMIRRLHVDPAQDRQTILVRMEAGASYFPHRHDAAEESFVLEGDVTADGETLTADDYHRAAAGSLHGAQTTESGCLLLIISSTQDDFLVASQRPWAQRRAGLHTAPTTGGWGHVIEPQIDGHLPVDVHRVAEREVRHLHSSDVPQVPRPGDRLQ